MLEAWLAWFDELVYEGDAARNPSWQRNRMEYAFALQGRRPRARMPTNTPTATSTGKTSAQPRSRSGTAAAGRRRCSPSPRVIPSPVRYPGMPAERYWEFEDGNVNFAGAEAGVTDLLRMTVTEFALTFGNDWFLVPVRLPVGWLYQRRRLRSHRQLRHRRAGGADPERRRHAPWTMYRADAPMRTCRARCSTRCSCPTASTACRKARCWSTRCWRATRWPTSRGRSKRRCRACPASRSIATSKRKALAFQQQIHFDSGADEPAARLSAGDAGAGELDAAAAGARPAR